MDAGFIDDSCLMCETEELDDISREIDRRLAAKGVSRGTGDKVKSTVRIICPVQDEMEYNEKENMDKWATPSLRNTYTVLQANSPVEYLGTMVGGDPEDTTSMQTMFRKVQRKWSGINSIAQPQTELI